MKVTKKGSWSLAVACACCNSEMEAGARDLRVSGSDFHVLCRVCGTACAVDADAVPPKLAEGARKRAEKAAEKKGKR